MKNKILLLGTAPLLVNIGIVLAGTYYFVFTGENLFPTDSLDRWTAVFFITIVSGMLAALTIGLLEEK